MPSACEARRRYADVIVNFDPHRVRKATKNHLESSNASRFVPHLGSLLLRRPTPGSQDWSGHLTIFCKVGALDRFGKGESRKFGPEPTVDGGHITRM